MFVILFVDFVCAYLVLFGFLHVCVRRRDADGLSFILGVVTFLTLARRSNLFPRYDAAKSAP